MSNLLGKVVVTGGAGAIGSRLIKRLLQNGSESVTVVDDLSSGYLWLLPHDQRIHLIRHDVARMQELADRVDEPIVFHLAAFFANQNSVEHPMEDLRTNGLGTLNALLWAKACSARKFVYASAGCSIAGHDVNRAICEDMPVSLYLDTPYQITKALGEFYCNYFNLQLSTVRCRFFNSYGPGEVPGSYRNVIPNFVWRALHNEPLIITGTGEETRDFIYVDDLVDGMIRATQLSAAEGQAFNLGTGVETRVIDVARWIIEACDSRSTIEFAERRPWDRHLSRRADITRARELLGFKPEVPIREGIERTVRWFRENKNRILAEA